MLLAGLACASASPALAADPNFLVVATDDQRAGTMKAMPKTRRWFDERGTRFPRAYVTTPLCCPSRASIFSGRYAHNHGQELNTGVTNFDPSTSFVRYLDEAGYRTGIVGKYLNTWSPSDPPPDFDDYKITPGGYYDSFWNLNGTTRTVGEYSTTFTRRKSIQFIRKAEGEDSTPWLLHVATSAPHGSFPSDPKNAGSHDWFPVEKKYADAPVGRFPRNPATEERNLNDKPPFLRDLIESDPSPKALSPKAVRRGQLRMLMSVDDMVAAILKKLAATGERRRTLVVFVSDNGLFWREHAIPPIKDLPYPEATRVPMMASWPGRIPRGAVDRRLVANIDIAPTIMAAAGLTPPEPMDGRSLLDSSWTRDRILVEYFGLRVMGERVIPRWAGLITPTYQFNQYEPINGHPLFREYYERAGDRWQLRNPLGNASTDDDPPEKTVQGLVQQLAEDLGCSGVTCP